VELEIPEDHIHMVARGEPSRAPSEIMRVIKYDIYNLLFCQQYYRLSEYIYHLSLLSSTITIRLSWTAVQKRQKMLVRFDNLSPFDFGQDETIELTGNLDTEKYSNLQYFSTGAKFKNCISTLIDRANKTDLNTIYGTIKIKENYFGEKNSPIDSVDDAIAKFEDVFIRNIRVQRKYSPPPGSERNKRKSDKPDNKTISGNFDLASRAPTTLDNPDMLNFMLYDCSYDEALKKFKKFEGFAEELGLSVRFQIFHYTHQTIWSRKSKPRFLPLRPRDGKTKLGKRLYLFLFKCGLFLGR
jgi:hypothetical protein